MFLVTDAHAPFSLKPLRVSVEKRRSPRMRMSYLKLVTILYNFIIFVIICFLVFSWSLVKRVFMCLLSEIIKPNDSNVAKLVISH